MSPEERDIRALQAEGYPAGIVSAGIRGETREQWLARRQQQDFEEAMMGPNGPERCWFYLHTYGRQPIRCNLPDGHPETPGVKGRGHQYEGV